MPQKLFRDPLYDYISLNKGSWSWLLKLLNTPEVQRLRYINQLGLSHLTYPGATHSRFSHSLGVLHLMHECISHLKASYRKEFKQLDEEALLAAALLHDIGHFPLSHVTEEVFGNHEERGISIVDDSDSEVNKILSKRGSSLPSKVIALLGKGSTGSLWQKSLISSQLDMDRLDYLRRDSLCSGAEYGHFDWFRIIHTMELREKVVEGKQKAIFVVWPEKTKYALEEYIFSRFYIYQSVYYHHTTRGFEGLVQRILERARDITRKDKNFAKTLLRPIQAILGGEYAKDPKRFQSLTDVVLFAQVTLFKDAKDKILKDLSGRLLARKGIGWAETTGMGFEMTQRIENVRGYLRDKKLDPKYYFYDDKTQATAYKPYSSAASAGEQSSVNSILLFDARWRDTGFCEISEIPGLERLRAITKTQTPILRYYFPKEHEKVIRKLLVPNSYHT